MYTSIRGEVFDLSKLTAAHQRLVIVVPSKSILNHGGEAADGIFPVQVCYCYGGKAADGIFPGPVG